MRCLGAGTKKAIIAFVGGALAFLMIATAQADYRTLYGDGQWHDMGGGWWYAYNSSLNDCYWRYSGVTRFAYDYDGGQWWDYRTSWGTLGAGGIMNDNFIGDGAWHGLNNGWNFAYNKALSDSYFQTGSAVRFAYDYDGGQWWDYGTSWYTLGASGLSQQFIGDGVFHSLGDGWLYAYNRALSDAYFNTGSAIRFSYDYDGTQWWHYRTSWYTLGASGVAQQFIGNGAWHNLNDGWSYAYNKGLDDAYWNTGTAVRFSYDYDGAQWWHYRASWCTWGASGVSQQFIGDGVYHDLNDGWRFCYWIVYDLARWQGEGDIWFVYNYDPGQWWHYRSSGGSTLGASGLSQQFIGDGAWHSLSDGWYFAYNKALNDAYWGVGGSTTVRFSYDYDAGQWWDYYGSRWHMLGLSNYSNAFIGDGTSHSFTGGGSYYYDSSFGGDGYWHYGSYDVYAIDYASSGLYLWDSGSWKNMTSYTSPGLGLTPTSTSNPEIRYVGDWSAGRFVETRLIYWGGADQYDLMYDYVSWSTSRVRTWITDWAIFNPGSDRIWSGTNGLKIGFLIEDGMSQWEDSKEDVIHFYDIDATIKNYGFTSIVTLIQRMTQFFGTLADIVAITQHGLPDQLGIGTDTVTSSNVSSYASLFIQWGSYMKSTGQIHFNHCLIAAPDNPPGDPVPNGVAMLNAIASYTQADVFASDDSTQIGPPQWPSNPDGYDWYMEYASNGNSLSYNCIYNYNTTNNKPYDPEWWEE